MSRDSEHTQPRGRRSPGGGRPRAVRNLVNAKFLASQHDSFEVPSEATLRRIKPGDFVKLARNGERFWVRVDGFVARRMHGTVDNDLVCNMDLKRGDQIFFYKRHIYDVLFS